MATELTVTLPDERIERVRLLAELIGQDVNVVFSMMLDLSLPKLMEMDQRSVESLPDHEVLALADSMMNPALNSRFSQLGERQREGIITAEEQSEMKIYMEIYEAGQRRKTDALMEAVRRGLRDRLDE